MRLALITCLAVIGFGNGPRASACSCVAPPPPARALAAADAVCLAEVVDVKVEGQSRTVTLKVQRWWKGGESAELVVSTAKDGATCGYNFEKGMRYLIYAGGREKGKPLHVSLCSRTRTEKAAETDGDFKELGEGKAPSDRK